MASKKSSSASGKRTPVKDLSSPAGRARKVKGGALLLSTRQLQASKQLADGQPPTELR